MYRLCCRKACYVQCTIQCDKIQHRPAIISLRHIAAVGLAVNYGHPNSCQNHNENGKLWWKICTPVLQAGLNSVDLITMNKYKVVKTSIVLLAAVVSVSCCYLRGYEISLVLVFSCSFVSCRPTWRLWIFLYIFKRNPRKEVTTAFYTVPAFFLCSHVLGRHIGWIPDPPGRGPSIALRLGCDYPKCG